MVELKDGRTYRILNKINHRVISISHDDKSHGEWLAIHNYDKDRYDSLFKATSCPGGNWKFSLVDKPNMCIGFHGKVSGEGLKMLQIVQDGGDGVHTEWLVAPGNGPQQFEVHAYTDSGNVCWTVPDTARAGAVVGLVRMADHPGQQWTFAVPVNE